jgi:hypothetical protein
LCVIMCELIVYAYDDAKCGVSVQIMLQVHC